MSNVTELRITKASKISMAEELFLTWYESTKALPHDYMEEVFAVFQLKLDRYRKRSGMDRISTAEMITIFKSAINKVASQQAMSRYGRVMGNEDEDEV